MSFDKLRKNSKAGTTISKLVTAAEKIGEKKSYGDDTVWKPTVDKTGNGYAIIRFLPAPEGEDLPWVQYWDHGFKGPTGRWYIEKSLTTLQQPDPVSEANTILWNSGNEDDKTIVRERKRKLHYVANIMVISDKDNPDTEGKVFKFIFGKKIFDKVMDVMQPEFDDEDPIDPFDFWAGANFKLKIRMVEGYRNYDKSEFDSPSELLNGDDEKLKEVYEKLYSLSDIIAPSEFKSYAELKAKFNSVIGEDEVASSYSTAETASLDETENSPYDSISTETVSESDSGSDEGSLSYFAKLAKED